MRTWRALLWKESREELPKVLVGLGLCAVVVALRQNAEFNAEFARDFGMWITIFIYGLRRRARHELGRQGKQQGHLVVFVGQTPVGRGGVAA